MEMMIVMMDLMKVRLIVHRIVVAQPNSAVTIIDVFLRDGDVTLITIVKITVMN